MTLSPKLLSTVKQVDLAMEVIQEKFMLMLIDMVFQNKLVKHISLKTLIISVALTFKNAKIVHHLQEQNQETKETVGLNQNIQSGK
jgi:hypothetical protein